MANDVIKKIMLRDLNAHVICLLCNGYFIDPVTINECLHSFCKTCILRHVETTKQCPQCDVQINKNRPYLSLRQDKALQSLVYKLVPGLHQNEMERRRKFRDKHEPTKVSKEELEKHFFFRDDTISMSLEYFDTDKRNSESAKDIAKKNPNKRYLACPGTVKVQHLMKFIIMKYGLARDSFIVDIIYNGEIIPDDYTLIDVAYYYKWTKDSPMQFFYRIFKKNKVILKRRKRKGKADDMVGDGKKPRPVEASGPNDRSAKAKEEATNNNNNNNNDEDKKDIPSKKDTDIMCRNVNKMPALQDETKAGAGKHKVSRMAKDDQPPTLVAATSLTTATSSKTSKTSKEATNKTTAVDHRGPPHKKLKIDIKDEPKIKIKLPLPPSINEDPKSNAKKTIDKVKDETNVVKKVSEKTPPKPQLVPTKSEAPVKTKLTNTEGAPATTSTLSTKPTTVTTSSKTPITTKATMAESISDKSVKIPSVTSSSSQAKKGNDILNDIVTNLAKKQQQMSQIKTGKSPDGNNDLSKGVVPKSLLGGQTSISKKATNESSTISSSPSPPSTNGIDKVIDGKSKGIPAGTSVTMRTVATTSTTSESISTSSSESANKPTATVSFSNSIKSCNVKTSMMNFVQPPSINGQKSLSPATTTAQKTSTTPSSSTLSDLRQFRKNGTGGTTSSSINNATTVATTSATPMTTTSSSSDLKSNGICKPSLTKKASIIPPIARTLTLSNTKNAKTGSGSQTSSALSKPIPKNGNSGFVPSLTNPPPQTSSPTSVYSTMAAAAAAAANLPMTLAGLSPEQMQMLVMQTMLTNGMMKQPQPPPVMSQQQLPSSRLQLKVQTTASSPSPLTSSPTASTSSPTTSSPLGTVGGKSPILTNPMPFFPSLVSHTVNKSPWNDKDLLRHTASPMTPSSVSAAETARRFSNLSKSLKNQTLRQIPNPSLLTKQMNDQQQKQKQWT